jgi:hypothetical protein
MGAIGASSAAILASGDQALRAVVRVGKGRGFVVEGSGDFAPERYVVTAAHCLPQMPGPDPGQEYVAYTYKDMLAPLGAEPSVWCECLFVDPIADIAVLGAPDYEVLSEQAGAYQELVAAAIPLAVAEPPPSTLPPVPEGHMRYQSPPIAPDIPEYRAFLLSLNNRWFPCTLCDPGKLWISNAAEDIEGGMSGSPIVTENGKAIGVACLSSGGDDLHHREGGPNPCLMRNLPGWFLKMLANKRKSARRRTA